MMIVVPQITDLTNLGLRFLFFFFFWISCKLAVVRAL